MVCFEIFCGIVAAIALLYHYFTSTFNYWKSRGIRGPQPIPIFGNFKDIMLSKKCVADFVQEVYNDYKEEPVIGIFARKSPLLIVKNPDLIKDILIKDFSLFSDRGFGHINEKNDPLSQHLFNLEAKRWRPLRMRLSPVFTSGKLKEMFSLMSECADHLQQHIEKLVSKNKPIECTELMAKYTTDVIGSCVFGIEMNALSDENSEFRRMGRAIFAPNWITVIRNGLKQSVPWLYDIFASFLPYTNVTNFFLSLAVENMNYREMNNIIRHDFINTLLELRRHPDKMSDIDTTDNLLAAQAFLFFIAGFETSSTTMSSTLYELALNQKIQDKLREEINQEYRKEDGDLAYENIHKMTYLDKVFKESLRKYPPGIVLMRKSDSDYTFNGTTISISKGQRIWIPIYAIQRDPSIYPNPDVFDPERFDEKVAQTRHAMFYLPFGDGPRNCIGARFAINQVKIGLIKILLNYKVETCETTQIPYVFDPKAFLLRSKDGIDLKITKIQG